MRLLLENIVWTRGGPHGSFEACPFARREHVDGAPGRGWEIGRLGSEHAGEGVPPSARIGDDAEIAEEVLHRDAASPIDRLDQNAG